MELGIGIGNLEFGYWIRIGDWGLEIEIWDWRLGLGLGIGIGYWGLGIGDWL